MNNEYERITSELDWEKEKTMAQQNDTNTEHRNEWAREVFRKVMNTEPETYGGKIVEDGLLRTEPGDVYQFEVDARLEPAVFRTIYVAREGMRRLADEWAVYADGKAVWQRGSLGTAQKPMSEHIKYNLPEATYGS